MLTITATGDFDRADLARIEDLVGSVLADFAGEQGTATTFALTPETERRIDLNDVEVILTDPDPEILAGPLAPVDTVIFIDTLGEGPQHIRIRLNDFLIFEGTPGYGPEDVRHDSIEGYWISQS